jgi:hypothetical protein
MRYAVKDRPVVRLVFELVEDPDAMPVDAARWRARNWEGWVAAPAPSETAVEAAFERFQELAEAFNRDLQVVYGSIEPEPLHMLRESDLRLFRTMLPWVRVERIETWDGEERFPEGESPDGG